MQIDLTIDDDTRGIIQDYLGEVNFEGTPEEYFTKNSERLLKDIIKHRWEKLNSGKTDADKVKDIKASKNS